MRTTQTSFQIEGVNVTQLVLSLGQNHSTLPAGPGTELAGTSLIQWLGWLAGQTKPWDNNLKVLEFLETMQHFCPRSLSIDAQRHTAVVSVKTKTEGTKTYAGRFTLLTTQLAEQAHKNGISPYETVCGRMQFQLFGRDLSRLGPVLAAETKYLNFPAGVAPSFNVRTWPDILIWTLANPTLGTSSLTILEALSEFGRFQIEELAPTRNFIRASVLLGETLIQPGSWTPFCLSFTDLMTRLQTWTARRRNLVKRQATHF